MKTYTEFVVEMAGKARERDSRGVEKNMTPEKAIKVLERTAKTIRADVGRGGNTMRMNSLRLVDTYNKHKDWLIDNGHHAHWKEFCKRDGSNPSHDGYDLYA
jgi:hypothetical protein